MPRVKIIQNENISVVCMTMQITLASSRSLKEKRSNILPILTRVRREFNCSIAELGLQDLWQSSVLGVVVISNNADHNTRVLQQIHDFIETHFPNIQVETFKIFSIW